MAEMAELRGIRRALRGGVVLAFGLATLLPASASATTPGTASNFTLVGHNSLFYRGVNAAPAIYGNYMYIGSRSDGTHAHSGVQIVDISNPAAPSDVGEIPLPADLTAGYTSRELRVWPQKKMLMVVYFGCSAILHACDSRPLTRVCSPCSGPTSSTSPTPPPPPW